MIDVLVVGGGTAGLATSIGCAWAGMSVVVAEPRSGPMDKACGGGPMPAAVTRLASIGVRPAGLRFRGIRYLDAGHRADAPAPRTRAGAATDDAVRRARRRGRRTGRPGFCRSG